MESSSSFRTSRCSGRSEDEHGKKPAMVQQPQHGDVIIAMVDDGFLIYRPPYLVLDDSHESRNPCKVATIEEAVAIGGLVAYAHWERVDLWLIDHPHLRLLVDGRNQEVDKTSWVVN